MLPDYDSNINQDDPELLHVYTRWVTRRSRPWGREVVEIAGYTEEKMGYGSVGTIPGGEHFLHPIGYREARAVRSNYGICDTPKELTGSVGHFPSSTTGPMRRIRIGFFMCLGKGAPPFGRAMAKLILSKLAGPHDRIRRR